MSDRLDERVEAHSMGRNDASNRPSAVVPLPWWTQPVQRLKEGPNLGTGSTLRLSDNVRQSLSSCQASECVSRTRVHRCI